MKHMRKILALMIAVVMCMAMSISVFAASHDVTITKATNDNGVHTYGAYQIFAGTSNPTKDAQGEAIAEPTDPADPKIGTISFGAAVAGKETQFISALKTAFGSDTATLNAIDKLTATSSAGVVAAAINEIVGDGTDTENGKKLAEVIANYITANSINPTVNKTGTAGQDVTITVPSDGYYFIKDMNAPTETDGAQTRYILEVIGDVTIKAKASVPSITKTVDDVNDSNLADTNNNKKEQTSADYDIGDKVPFTITATSSSLVSDYYKYHLTIEDKLSPGLSEPDNYTLTVLGQTFNITKAGAVSPATATTTNGTKITVSKVTPDTNNTFAIRVEFVNNSYVATTNEVKINAEANSQNVVLKYESELNTNAVIGAAGNPNETYLEYSSNPNSKDDSDQDEVETPHKYNKVFTYKTIVNKFDEDGTKPLKGADFTLYKLVESTGTDSTSGNPIYPTGAKTGAAIKEAYGVGTKVKASDLVDDKYYVEARKTGTITEDTTTFNFEGLDDGTYVLVETTIPNGYNPFDSVKFDIIAVHEDIAGADAQGTDVSKIVLTSLNGEEETGEVTLEGDQKGNVDKAAGSITTGIVNKTGTTLPETGGIGTTMFYAIGAIMVVGAGIILITRRRMRVN